MMCMMMRMAGTLFDHNHEQQRNLLHKLFPRVLHDISYILRIPNVASGMVRKPLSSWRGDLHALAGSETASDLEDGFDDSSAQVSEEDGDPMVEGLGGYEGGGAGGEGGDEEEGSLGFSVFMPWRSLTARTASYVRMASAPGGHSA